MGRGCQIQIVAGGHSRGRETQIPADDTSLFSVVHNVNTKAKELNNDIVKIGNWTYQWKMSFILNPSTTISSALA